VKIFLLHIAIAVFFLTGNAYAASIQYIDTGKESPKIKITCSRNNGASWKQDYIKKGQTYMVPPDATHLMINDIPRDPKRNYKVKEGNVY